MKDSMTATEMALEVQPEPTPGPSHEDIARLAYHLWEARDKETGSPEEDWYQAEQLLRG